MNPDGLFSSVPDVHSTIARCFSDYPAYLCVITCVLDSVAQLLHIWEELFF